MRSFDHIDDDEKIIFIHIPKTAGTSINHFFRQLVGANRVGWLGIDFRVDEIPVAPRLAGYRVIGGHFTSTQSNCIRFPAIRFSTVREPVSRVISYYRHAWGIPSEAESMELTGDILRDLDHKFGSLVTNQQCHFLGIQEGQSPKDFFSTNERLHVYPVEQSDQMVKQISSAMRLPTVELPVENVGQGPRVEPTQDVVDKIRSITTRDQALHDFLLSN